MGEKGSCSLDPYAGITRIRFNGYNLRPRTGTTPCSYSVALNGDIVKPSCRDNYLLRIYRVKHGRKIFWDTAFIDAGALSW